MQSLVPEVQIEPPATGGTLTVPILQLLGAFTLSLGLWLKIVAYCVCIIHNILFKEETHGVAHP